jgi:hypothetical protein
MIIIMASSRRIEFAAARAAAGRLQLTATVTGSDRPTSISHDGSQASAAGISRPVPPTRGPRESLATGAGPAGPVTAEKVHGYKRVYSAIYVLALPVGRSHSVT